ncbi:MAG TPA: hypothetical protein VIH57_24525 [Bacteroidales bacterium]
MGDYEKRLEDLIASHKIVVVANNDKEEEEELHDFVNRFVNIETQIIDPSVRIANKILEQNRVPGFRLKVRKSIDENSPRQVVLVAFNDENNDNPLREAYLLFEGFNKSKVVRIFENNSPDEEEGISINDLNEDVVKRKILHFLDNNVKALAK